VASENSQTSPSIKRDAILYAAAEVFMARGYSATSIDDVAKRLKSTKGKIYYYYSSKAELFFEIHIAALRMIADRIDIAHKIEGTASKRIWAMARAHADTLMEEFPLQKVAVQGLERHLLESGDALQDRMARRVVSLRDDYERIFVETISEGKAAGEFRADLDPRLAAKFVLGALNWMVIWFQPRKSQSKQSKTISIQLADFILEGLVKGKSIDFVR
jgi:AcrR family transcriptional regulator